MRIFALGDTHLAFARDKPMDVFGELWRDHPQRIAEAWDARVRDEDVVLVVGDISWGRNLEEAAPDLAFVAKRPGRLKLLLRGNHDSWWSSAKKVRAALPETLEILSNDALRLDEGVVLCGGRLWNLPTVPWFKKGHDEKILVRELGRLRSSLERAHALRQPGDLLIALLHYPPLGPGETDSEPLALLREAGVSLAAYGHLHGEDHAWAPQGLVGGVDLRFVAGDYVGFTPQIVWEEGRGLVAQREGSD